MGGSFLIVPLSDLLEIHSAENVSALLADCMAMFDSARESFHGGEGRRDGEEGLRQGQG